MMSPPPLFEIDARTDIERGGNPPRGSMWRRVLVTGEGRNTRQTWREEREDYRDFLEKYQSVTLRSLLPARSAAAAWVRGAGTITSCPGRQLAGQATPFASTVWRASTTRMISSKL